MGDYPVFHQHRTNLLIHAVMVPAFVACALGSLAAAASGRFTVAGLLLLGLPASMAVQGLGHKREPVPPRSFRGPGDVLARIFAEQFYRFPRFVLDGGWQRAWQAAAR
jgi:hypothetical protein